MIRIRVQRIDLNEFSTEQIELIRKNYQFALDRFMHAIREVEVWCRDVNGPRGGIDKSCRVQIRLYPRGVVTAKSSGTSIVQAANEACEKAKALILKKLSKRRSYNRASQEIDLVSM